MYLLSNVLKFVRENAGINHEVSEAILKRALEVSEIGRKQVIIAGGQTNYVFGTQELVDEFAAALETSEHKAVIY